MYLEQRVKKIEADNLIVERGMKVSINVPEDEEVLIIDR